MSNIFGSATPDPNDDDTASTQTTPTDESNGGGGGDQSPQDDGDAADESVDAVRSDGHYVGVDPIYRNAANESHAPLDGEGDEGKVFATAAEREAEVERQNLENAERKTKPEDTSAAEATDDSSDDDEA